MYMQESRLIICSAKNCKNQPVPDARGRATALTMATQNKNGSVRSSANRWYLKSNIDSRFINAVPLPMKITPLQYAPPTSRTTAHPQIVSATTEPLCTAPYSRTGRGLRAEALDVARLRLPRCGPLCAARQFPPAPASPVRLLRVRLLLRLLGSLGFGAARLLRGLLLEAECDARGRIARRGRRVRVSE